MVFAHVPDRQRRAQGSAGVPGGRLNPHPLKDPFPLDQPVGHAVERDTAGETQIALAGDGSRMPGQSQHDLLGDHLNGAGHVHVTLLDGRFRLARRAAKQLIKFGIRHPQAAKELKVFKIQAQ